MFTRLKAEEAAQLIQHGMTVGFSGFTPAGAVKAVPRALAARAKEAHAAGKPFTIRALTGASTGKSLDETLALAEAISWRAPYQSSNALRKQINTGKCEFVDMHLSHVAQTVEAGFFGKVDVAVVEATEVTADGKVYLTSSVGASPTYLKCADKVIIEINSYHSSRTREMMDIVMLAQPPYRKPININSPLSKVGVPYATVDPKKIVGIVETNEPDEVNSFDPANCSSERIAKNVVRFLVAEMQAGRIPKEFLPLQAGVGNVANSVMAELGRSAEVPPFMMYSEVFQDALVDAMLAGKLVGASATSLTLTSPQLEKVYANMDFFAPKICLRPQELSNNPGIVRRLGVIAMNTAIEVDIYGHANSSHVSGINMMNGIGGSGDFVRNAYLSIFMCPSFAKSGKISTIVPMCSHVDHNEHSVQIVVTEQGLADLRGLGPLARAHEIINKCAHPAYRDYLNAYITNAPKGGHIRHDLSKCFDMHLNLARIGQMVPDVDLKAFEADTAIAGA